jgi:hypothetical protein
MRVEIREESITFLEEYAGIPISFGVDSVLDVKEQGDSPGEFLLTERNLDIPYVKDYDAIDGEPPNQLAKRFDILNWGVFAARIEGQHVGGGGCCL